MLLISAALVAPRTVYLGTDGRYIENTAPLIVGVSQIITCQLLIAASGFGVRPSGIFANCRRMTGICKYFTETKNTCFYECPDGGTVPEPKPANGICPDRVARPDSR
jgi:hypothetical protein